MGFMDEYNAIKEGKKKKKKGEQISGGSFMDEYNALKESDDIAPVTVKTPLFTNKTAALYGGLAPITKTTGMTTADKEEEDDLREASWWEATVKSAQRGYYNALYGEETYASMLGQENSADVYRKILEGDEYQFEAEGGLKKAVSGAAELLGQMARQYTDKDTLNAGIAGAGAGAGTALLLGQAGPQVLVPEEALTVPAGAIIGFKAGMTGGNAKSALEIEAGHAYNEMMELGVSEETAKNIALGVGGVNAALEALQVDELFDAFKVLNKTGATDTATKLILKELRRRGVDVAVETAQEVAQEGVTIAGVQTASKKDKGEWAYTKEDVASRMGETALSSALSFGAMNIPAGSVNVGRIVSDNANAQKLTSNEQKVVEKEIENRIAEQEKDGKKLTKKEKAAIEEAVVRDMDKGYISTDTIEEVLGGETYKTHKTTIENEKAMQEEYDKLFHTKNGEKSDADIARQAELKQKLEDIKQNFNQNQLGEEVFSMVQGERLVESYNERSRRGQAFEADITKYDAKQQETVKKAIESGILNNTRRTHEFVDLIAKITADKGVSFDFTNNERLKESGFAKDAVVNGFVKGNNVTLNIDSAKALNRVVGHEVTHVLEGTEFYDALQKTAFEYAKTKGEYDSRLQSVTELYQRNDPEADPTKELTADLVGDYLFSDADFVNHLSVSNRNVFQKIYDEIKYLRKVATAGSKEARELERVKKLFEDAYRADGKAQTDTKYSLTEYSQMQLDNWKSSKKIVVYKDAAQLVDFVHTARTDPQFVKKMYFGIVDGLLAADIKAETGYDFTGKNVALRADNIKKIFKDHGNATKEELRGQDAISETDFAQIPEVIGNPDKINKSEYVYGDRKSPAAEFVKTIDGRRYTVFAVDSGKTSLDLFVHTMYVGKQKKSIADTVNAEANASALTQTPKVPAGTALGETVPHVGGNVKLSLSDSDGKQLSKEQQEFFKDSMVRDGDGNLLKVYHTTNNDFTVFDKARKGEATQDGNTYMGFFFSDDAEYMQNFPEFKDGKTDAYYLNIRKPIDMTNISKDAFLDIVEVLGGDVDTAADVYEEMTLENGDVPPHLIYLLQETGADTTYADFIEELKPHYDELMAKGYDGVVNYLSEHRGIKEYIVLDSNQAKLASNDKPTADPDIRRSLSQEGEGNQFAPLTSFDVFGKDMKRKTAADDEFAPFLNKTAPVQEAPVKDTENTMTAAEMFPDDAYAPIADDPTRFDSLDDADAPPVRYAEAGVHGDQMTMPKSTVNMIAQNVKSSLWVEDRQMGDVRRIIEDYGKQEFPDKNWLFNELKDNFGKHTEKMVDDETKNVKNALRKYRLNVSDHIKSEIADYNDLRRSNFGKVLFSRQGTDVDAAYEELSNMYPGFFPPDITNPTDQLLQIVDVANMNGTTEQTYEIEDEVVRDVVEDIAEAVADYQHIRIERDAGKVPEGYMDDLVEHGDEYAPMMAPNRPVIDAPVADAPTYDAQPRKGVNEGQQAMFKEEPITEEERRQTRKQLHKDIVDGIKADFKTNGFDLDSVLKNAKNLSTFATVDNMPQRVMEKALGYKEGQVLSDLTVNKVAQNETEGIKWLNSYTDRKNGLLKQLSEQYHIKPGSKESAAAQMYAEGFYVAENNDIIAYGDAELAKDFPDANVQQNIKRLARDPRIRRIYDDTLAMINESRTRNAYPEIQKLDNYFLHFRAMDDTFSKLGLPFNPNDIRAKDLPTDLNGVTADLKPGQPYFASAMHRTGKRTSFDLLGGLERYLTSAKNQIYHIDDIQTLRALRNYIADTYGQANGLEGLDALSEEEAQDRIEKVYNSHLSTFAKFLNEEANILAGKTALIDRGLEGILGRRGMTFLDSLNKQVGSNMVGFNISSSLTNFLPVAQTFAKTNKADFVKAFAQTVGNKVGGMFGRTDGFAESSPVIIRRKGADRFYRTPWQKAGDAGYVLMSAVDDISTELIARTKYNELVRNGMDAQKAHYETDKWVSRLMGDRSIGQMPQLYNSKMLGLVTKFQLEVRNQLDSQFYDTIQEAKVSEEHIKDGLARNAKIAAKCASTFVQLAFVQHLFGKAFESVAGYNPAFDIISVLMTAFGFDDDDDSEDAALDNIEQAFLELLEDLPYTSTFTGGRIPISSALPITELVKGEDEWGNEKSRWKTLGEIAPYYALPGGYGQIKKTVQGLSMFSDDHPIAGSYTKSGNLRFPVEDTLGNRIQAGLFGQWASENARDYFDNERSPLKEKQIEEFVDLDIPIRDYWEYREGLSGLTKLEEKADYIAGLDLPISKKNLLINNIADREEDIDLTGYEDFDGFAEFDFAVNNPEKYKVAQQVGGYEAYMKYQEGMKNMKLAEKFDYVARLNLTDAQKNALINGETERKEPIDMTGYDPSVYSGFEEFEFAKENPGNYGVAKVVGGYNSYKSYMDEISEIGKNNDSDSGIRDKDLITDYINGLDLDYGQKAILYRSKYSSKADKRAYDSDIFEYLNGRDDISYEEKVEILKKLGFTVSDDGYVTW